MMSDNELKKQTENLKSNLNTLISSEKEKIEILLKCLNSLNTIIQEEDNFDNPTELIDLLSNIKSNLDNSRSNISTFESVIQNIDTSLLKSNKEETISEIEQSSNEISIEPDTAAMTSETIETNIVNSNDELVVETQENQVIKLFEQNSYRPEDNGLNSNLKTEICDNNTLLISEIQNKVVLPYSVSELEKELEENTNYTDLQDIINKKYTIPLDKYKNAALARFKEAYNLMRKRENASITSSLDLALELTFNNLLNPAIITACKNLDELDIYLDYLSSNELDKFKIFDIKYEMLPTK